MVEIKKDERSIERTGTAGDKVIIRRVMEEEYEAGEYVRSMEQIKQQIAVMEQNLNDTKKVLEELGGLQEEMNKAYEDDIKKRREEAMKDKPIPMPDGTAATTTN